MNRTLTARLARIELVGRDTRRKAIIIFAQDMADRNRQWAALVADGQTDGRCAVLSLIGNIAPQPPMITGAF